MHSYHFVNSLGEISPKLPFLPNSPFSPNSPTFRGPSSWVNLFALIISSTALAKFHQNRHFRQIRQHFGALLAGLIYSLLSFRQQPWRNFAKIAIFAKFAVFAKFANISGPSSWVNLFALIISSTALAKFRQNRHFRQIRQHFGALLAGLIYSLLSFRLQPWRNFAKIAIFAKFANISGPF